MILYHGSVQKIQKPVIIQSQRLLDFGMGFYTTTNKEQAEKWAKIKQHRKEGIEAIISVYELADEVFTDKSFKIKNFEKASEEWLDFIILNRTQAVNHGFDIVKGAVANDTLYATLLLFESGVLNKVETISRLKTHKLFDQISFHNQQILNKLVFKEAFKIG